jgi:hypothetical protein
MIVLDYVNVFNYIKMIAISARSLSHSESFESQSALTY